MQVLTMKLMTAPTSTIREFEHSLVVDKEGFPLVYDDYTQKPVIIDGVELQPESAPIKLRVSNYKKFKTLSRLYAFLNQTIAEKDIKSGNFYFYENRLIKAVTDPYTVEAFQNKLFDNKTWFNYTIIEIADDFKVKEDFEVHTGVIASNREIAQVMYSNFKFLLKYEQSITVGKPLAHQRLKDVLDKMVKAHTEYIFTIGNNGINDHEYTIWYTEDFKVAEEEYEPITICEIDNTINCSDLIELP